MADVCIVCLHAYPLFRPSANGSFGGTEVRAWLLARALARRGKHQVSFLVFDHGQPTIQQIDGVIVRAHSAYQLVPGSVSSTDPARLSTLQRVLRRTRNEFARVLGSIPIDGISVPRQRVRYYRSLHTDLYCVFGVSNLAAEVAEHCRRAHGKMLLVAGSDEDFSAMYRPGSKEVNPYGSIAGLCHFAIKSADAIVAQTNTQARLVRARFKREAVVIRNPIDLDRIPEGPVSGDRVALWVGKADQIKQPQVLIHLASANPSIRFLAVMNRSDPEIFEDVRRRAPSNLEIVERLPLEAVERLFLRAFVLVNTSRFEGFPNTFLQAGKFGVPVVSLHVDPDGVIKSQDCGSVTEGDVDELARAIARLHDDPLLAARQGRNLRTHVEAQHRLDDIAREFESLLMKMTTDD